MLNKSEIIEQKPTVVNDINGESFETMRALQQNLTFNKLQQQFEKYQLAFDASKRITLGLENNDSIYTNLAILLSDQCQSTIKVATFAGTDKNIFTDRREFSGSLFKQMEELYDYLELRNELKASFNGLYRSDKRNYPPQAIREAMLNCIVHRDYALSAATLVSVFEDRIEFISPGGLVNGVELADIMLGLSVCRNPKLAAVFYRLQLIEAYGTGIAKIMSAYDDSVLKPKIEVTPNAFKITLPNLNYLAKIHDDDLQDNDYKKAIISYISYHTIAYRKDIDKLLGTSQSTSSRLLKLMIKQDLIYAIGKGKNIHYKIKKHS